MSAIENLIAACDCEGDDIDALKAAAREERDELVAACNEALPWVATAMAHRRDSRPEFDAHPDAVKNHADALARLQAVLAKHAKAAPVGGPYTY